MALLNLVYRDQLFPREVSTAERKCIGAAEQKCVRDKRHKPPVHGGLCR
jgi:hypothetical protein